MPANPYRAPSDQPFRSYGQIAYERYCEIQGWKSYHGEDLPQWADLREDIRKAWGHAALAAVDSYIDSRPKGK